MSTTPPGPYPPQPPAGGYPPQQPPGGWNAPTGGFPGGPSPKKGLPVWAGVAIGVGIGAIVAALAAIVLLGGDDDGDETAVMAGTTAPQTTPTTEPTPSTTEDPDAPGGLDSVAVDAAESISETFDATAEEEACMLEAFADNPELFAALDEDELTDPDLMVDIIGVAKDCLDPDDLAASFTEGMLEGSDVDLTAEQASCLSDELLSDDDLLAVLVVLGLDPDAAPTGDQIGPLFELFATCDLASVIAESMRADDPTMDEQQSLCIAEGMLELEPELLEELLGLGTDPDADPSAEMLAELFALFADCGIELPATVAPGGVSGPT